MAHNKKHRPPFPSKDAILAFIKKEGDHVGKREIASAFHLKGEHRIQLKQVLRELQEAGLIDKGRGKRFAQPGTLPEVTVVMVSEIDTDGEVIARPQTWNTEKLGLPPRIYMAPQRHGEQALGEGDRALTRLKRLDETTYEGKVIQVIGKAQPRVLGLFSVDGRGEARITPTDKKQRAELMVAREHTGGARPGDLVRAEILPGRKLGLRWGKVIENLHNPDSPRSLSLISIHEHDIQTEFSDEALQEAAGAGAAPLQKREDLRDMPLITIDGADARDYDDAVWAECAPDEGDNPSGWHLIVAIADVSWYVRPGMALDEDAYERGNSTYFPDRCVPMLPEDLSTGWCSLNPGQERPVIAAHMWIDASGNLLRHNFTRAVMRSAARLTYSQAQTAFDGAPDETAEPIMETVITPLYQAYAALEGARRQRGVLELDIPERRILLDDNGNVDRVEPRVRYDSHRLIEEFMILANVAAAETLERLHKPCMYRVHDHPGLDKLEALREFLDSLDIKLPRGQLRSAQFNRILDRVKGTPVSHMVNAVVLRSQSQAAYSPRNVGHFGLALKRYAHFTSPIRRYADLLVHRALVSGLKLGDGGLPREEQDFQEMGEHISGTERRSTAAERNAMDRFTAAYLAERVGATFAGRVTGVTRFGLFVSLDEVGGDGLIPIRTLPDDYYEHDETRHRLVGRATNLEFRLGQELSVVLKEANPATGGLILSLPEEDFPAPRAKGGAERKPRKKRGKPGRPERNRAGTARKRR